VFRPEQVLCLPNDVGPPVTISLVGDEAAEGSVAEAERSLSDLIARRRFARLRVLQMPVVCMWLRGRPDLMRAMLESASELEVLSCAAGLLSLFAREEWFRGFVFNLKALDVRAGRGFSREWRPLLASRPPGARLDHVSISGQMVSDDRHDRISGLAVCCPLLWWTASRALGELTTSAGARL
jgi:hypothetical protein